MPFVPPAEVVKVKKYTAGESLHNDIVLKHPLHFTLCFKHDFMDDDEYWQAESEELRSAVGFGSDEDRALQKFYDSLIEEIILLEWMLTQKMSNERRVMLERKLSNIYAHVEYRGEKTWVGV